MSGSFSLDLSKFALKVGVRADAVVRRIAFEAFSGVVLKTPVDTGRARANWIPAVGEMPTGTVDGVASPLGAIATAVGAFTAGKVIFIANNLPYIARLEDGYSQQAPQGMVARTMLEITSKFDTLAKSAISGGKP